jgi:hypothetical protein
LLHLPYNFLSHHPGAKQVENKVTRVHVRDDQLTDWNFLATR